MSALVTVGGRFENPDNTAPTPGEMVWQLAPTDIPDTVEPVVVLGGPVTVPVDVDGAFTVDLRATDDPDLVANVTGPLVYKVTRNLNGSRTNFTVTLPAPGPWDWTELSPAVDSAATVVPVPGPQGDKGDKGDKGDTGPAGADGELTQAAADTRYVNTAGDAMTGNLSLEATGANTELTLRRLGLDIFKVLAVGDGRLYIQAVQPGGPVGTLGNLIYVLSDGQMQFPGRVVNGSTATSISVPVPTLAGHAARKADVDTRAPLCDRVFIPATELEYTMAAPTQISRTWAVSRPVVQFGPSNTGPLLLSIDPVAQGITHWKTYGAEWVLSCTAADTGTVRMRLGAFVADVDGTDPIVPSVTGLAYGRAMSGVTDRIEVMTGAGTMATPATKTAIWRAVIDRNGANASDTSSLPVNLHGIALYKVAAVAELRPTDG